MTCRGGVEALQVGGRAHVEFRVLGGRVKPDCSTEGSESNLDRGPSRPQDGVTVMPGSVSNCGLVSQGRLVHTRAAALNTYWTRFSTTAVVATAFASKRLAAQPRTMRYARQVQYRHVPHRFYNLDPYPSLTRPEFRCSVTALPTSVRCPAQRLL